MLIVKYEKFSIVSKDQYVEEMLHKYDKNLTFHQQFEKKGKDLIYSITTIINDTEDINSDMSNICAMYD